MQTTKTKIEVLPLTAEELETLRGAAQAEQSAAPDVPPVSLASAGAPPVPAPALADSGEARLLAFCFAALTVLMSRFAVSKEEFRTAVQETLAEMNAQRPTDGPDAAGSDTPAEVKGVRSEQY